MRTLLGLLALTAPLLASAAPYEIGDDLTGESFWTSDPVLFVRKHAESGLEFTSDQRTGAASRLDGGVSYFGVPVYETRIAFGEAGGITRVELMLFNTGGTEAMQETVEANGSRFRRRVRVDKTIDRAGFKTILDTVRTRLSSGGKVPAPEKERTSDAAIHQAAQTWPAARTVLSWNFVQQGKDESSFRPGFIRVAVDAPGRPSAKGKASAKEAKKIVDNVVRDPRGDVFIDNVPMVDQGQKGYCSVATAERVLRYFGLTVDEHEIAQAAGTTAEGGTSTRAMKESVEAIGKRFKLATVVCYGDFEKSSSERIASICDEVKAYNKAAKKLKKPAIEDSVFIRHEGNVTMFDPNAADKAMDVEVRKEMRVNGMQKSKYTRFLKDIHEQIAKGIPLFWGVTLGTYPEPGLPQTAGGHMRLIIGYNDKKKEILYSDSWGAGHELKRMPADWAWTISHCLMYMKPLTR